MRGKSSGIYGGDETPSSADTGRAVSLNGGMICGNMFAFMEITSDYLHLSAVQSHLGETLHC